MPVPANAHVALIVVAAPDPLGEMRPHLDKQLTGTPGSQILAAIEAS